MRNNNPLNIRRNNISWHGSSMYEQRDPDFVTFDTIDWGYRAAWKVLRSYHRRLTREFESFNIVNIISQWAPEADGNDVQAYVKAVEKLSKLSSQESFGPPDAVGNYEKMLRLLVAMTCVECGMKPKEVNLEAIREGYFMAFLNFDISDEDLAVDEMRAKMAMGI